MKILAIVGIISKRGVHVSWVSMLGFIESCHYHYTAVVPIKYRISVSLKLRGY